MLFARRNQAYVDDEEQAKKITFERTIKWVNKLYPEENKEVKLTPVKISSQLQYGYDTLFESFKSSIEQVLSASYNDDKTTEKSYETTRKYNQLSSYLKNIINMNQITPEDEERIKKDFNGLKDKLTALKNLAVANAFGNEKDIVEMVDAINETTPTPKGQYEKVKSNPTEMVDTIEAKSNIQNKARQSINELENVQKYLQALTQEQTDSIQYDKVLDKSVNLISAIPLQDLKDAASKINDPRAQALINDVYDGLKYIKDKFNTNSAETIADMVNEIQDYVKDLPNKINDIGLDVNAVDANEIDSKVDPFINTQQTEYDNDLNTELFDANKEFTDADAVIKSLQVPVQPKKRTMIPMPEPVEPNKPPKFVKDNTLSKADNILAQQKYLKVKEQYENDKIAYIADKKAYDTAKANFNIKVREYNSDVDLYNEELKTNTEIRKNAQLNIDKLNKFLGESKQFWIDTSDEIKKNIEEEVIKIKDELSTIDRDLRTILATPPQDEQQVKQYYDELKSMDTDLDELRLRLDEIFNNYIVAPTLPTVVSKGPPIDFKAYFLQEYNNKFKTIKTNTEITGKWTYYLTLLKGTKPTKQTIDARIKIMKK